MKFDSGTLQRRCLQRLFFIVTLLRQFYQCKLGKWIFLVVVGCFSKSALFAQSSFLPGFYVHIKESTPYFESDYYFSADSIVVSSGSTDFTTAKDIYARVLKKTEVLQLINQLGQLHFDQQKPSHVFKDFYDHAGEYNFSIYWQNKHYTIMIWGKKVDAYFELVKVLNKLLPENHQIRYTEKYLQNGKD